jgi:uncharacterized membrane protein
VFLETVGGIEMFESALVLATLLCGLVAGLLFGFAVVAMPGINSLDDRGFIRSFQAMDRVIQDNQPLFMVAWVGSVIALVATTLVGFGRLQGQELGLLVAAAVIYVVGVQLPTAVINIPLNNRLQLVDTDQAGEDELAAERQRFESRWNRWNNIRAALSAGTTALLLVVVLQL